MKEEIERDYNKFVDEFQSLLSKHMPIDADERKCLSVAVAILYEAIDVLYCNTNNYDNFIERTELLFSEILECWAKATNFQQDD